MSVKKALVLLTVLLVLAAAIFFAMRRTGRGAREFSIDRAAELAPAEATFFWVMPDLERTKARWKGSELFPVAHGEGPGAREPEEASGKVIVAGLLAPKPGQFLSDLLTPLAYGRGGVKGPAGLEQMGTTALWIAAEGFRGPHFQMVVGVRYQAKKSAVDGVIQGLKGRFFAAQPDAKSELSSEYGIEIESIQGSTQPVFAQREWWTVEDTLCIAFRDDWVFLATDRAMLRGVLGRYVGAVGAGQALAGTAWFAECRRQALAEADFCMWSRWGPYTPGMAEGFDLSVSTRGEPEPSEVTAVQYEGRVDGATSGRVYVQLTELPPPETGESGARLFAFNPGGLIPPSAIERAEAVNSAGRVFSKERLEVDFDNLPLGARGWLVGSRWEMWGTMRSWPSGGIVAEIGEVFGPELTLVVVGREARETGFMMALELRDLAEAFRMGEVIDQAQRPAGLDELRGLWDLAFAERRRMRGPAGVARAQVRFEFSAGAEGSAAGEARFYVEGPGLFEADAPGVFEWGRIGLPWMSLAYRPWLQASGAKAAEAQVPGAIRVRKEGRNWVIDSDLNVLGFSFLQEMMERRL